MSHGPPRDFCAIFERRFGDLGTDVRLKRAPDEPPAGQVRLLRHARHIRIDIALVGYLLTSKMSASGEVAYSWLPLKTRAPLLFHRPSPQRSPTFVPRLSVPQPQPVMWSRELSAP